MKKMNEDQFFSVARFSERGTVRIAFNEPVKVDSVKIEIHEGSTKWLIINEIHVVVE